MGYNTNMSFISIQDISDMIRAYIDTQSLTNSHYYKCIGYIDCLMEIEPLYKNELLDMKIALSNTMFGI